jgi:hypothetical protein
MNTLTGASGMIVHTLEYIIKQEAEMRYHLCVLKCLQFFALPRRNEVQFLALYYNMSQLKILQIIAPLYAG